ncbi:MULTISPECIES: GNAT family N-acetyltransferase [unclassified Frankia]|uniref:GNAT family N-acetyltransferase n=1 Tax=unclassified Frankia TaxID=2632575 RepID=UPI002AD3247D|nr:MULTISPECIES: GNAT family N-acetyltransferase [unclassified Frankia]
MKLEIRRAGPEDLDAAVDILAEAARWLASRGIRQRPEHGFPATDVAERIERGEMYLARLDGDPVATIAIDWDDEYFWSSSDHDAVYVHRMAVRRRWAGRKIGERLLDWAAERTAIAGRAWVRLDCVTANVGLCQYYLDCGWTHVRDVTDEIGTESLFQRPAGLGGGDSRNGP